MSNRAINAVLDYSKTKGSMRLLMVIIADGIGKDTGFYRAKIETLRREANCTERYIQQLVKKLLKTGELVVQDVPGHASQFYIPLFPQEPGYAPEVCDSDTHTCARRHTPLDITREDVRNADDFRRRKPQRGAPQFTQRGVQEYTPHQKPRTGVNRSTPPGEQEYTPPVNRSTPPGEQEYTQYPPLTHLSLPIDVPGVPPITNDKKTEGASPLHMPSVNPITELRRKMEDTAPHPHSAAPLAPAREVWRQMKEEVWPRLNEAQRKEYLERLDFGHIEAEDWAILAPTPFVAEHVENCWGDHLRKALEHAAGPDAHLHIVSLPKGVSP